MKKKYTPKTISALKTLENTSRNNVMPARGFALLHWGRDASVNTKRSNGGNGCQIGKAGWLQAGSYLSKLEKRGLVKSYFGKFESGYYISEEGKKVLEENKHLLKKLKINE